MLNWVEHEKIFMVGRLSLSVGWEKSPERGRKTISFNPTLPVI